MTLETLLVKIDALPDHERSRLIELLNSRRAANTGKTGEQGRHSITELRGLGKAVWRDIDPQQYVNALRREWEQRP
jgi:hypothetical protein